MAASTTERLAKRWCTGDGRGPLGLVVAVLIGLLVRPAIVSAQRPECSAWPHAGVQLQARALDFSTSMDADSVFPDEEDEPRYVFVRFHHRLTVSEHMQLESLGIDLLESLQNCAYIAKMTAAQWESLELARGLDFVRLGGALLPADKVSSEIQRGSYSEWAYDSVAGRLQVVIGFHRDVTRSQAVGILDGMAGVVLQKAHGPGTIGAELEINAIASVAGLDPVRRIEEGPTPFVPLNGTARPVVHTDAVQSGDFSGPAPVYELDGRGVRIGICDDGVLDGHPDFGWIAPDGALMPSSRVYSDAGGAVHGTQVASVAAGSGYVSRDHAQGPFFLRGHAPGSEIGDYTKFGADLSAYRSAILDDGADVTNHSYLQSFTVYDEQASEIDQIVRGVSYAAGVDMPPPRPQVWAAGNNGLFGSGGAAGEEEEGYYSVFTSAKNPLSVGSVDSRKLRITSSSSLGPTFDGRIKPDLVAPGCGRSTVAGAPSLGIESASHDGSYGYDALCGTSMAAPVVTGIIALMMDRYERTFGLFPDLQPSTYKAMLIQTATDQVKPSPYGDLWEYDNPDTHAPLIYHAGPDFATGYGLVDARRATEIIGDPHRWRESSISLMYPVHRRCLLVPAGSSEIRVTLAWDDEPGSTVEPETSPKLTNDLDLRLISPSGRVIQPWTLVPPPLTAVPGSGDRDPISSAEIHPAKRSIDWLNNVEMASDCLPEAGVWQVEVDAGSRLPLGRSQPYSLAASHGFLPYCPIEVPICRLHPWICQVTELTKLEFQGPSWLVNPRSSTPIRELCKHLPECPMCEGMSWSACPGWQLVLAGLPRDARVIVFDSSGELFPFDEPAHRTANEAVIRVGSIYPGQDFHIAFADGAGNPYPQPFEVRVELRQIVNGP